MQEQAVHIGRRKARILEDLFKEQAAGGRCQGGEEAVGFYTSCYFYDHDDILIRPPPIDDALQKVFLVTLRAWILYLCH